MTDISLDTQKLRRREIEINVAMNQGALEMINNLISEVERRRGGRPRKSAEVSIIPQRVAGAAHEPECDEQGPLPTLDDVRGILKENVG